MSSQAPTYSVRVTSDDLQAMKEVLYRFLETSYAASSPELKSDRTISVEDIAIAYKTESVFCLFERRRSQGWKAIIYAPEPEHRNVVETFLQGNQIEVRELDENPPKPPAVCADVESNG